MPLMGGTVKGKNNKYSRNKKVLTMFMEGNIEGKKLVAVGVGAIGKHFEMFFYMEGDKGIFFFQRFRESKDIAKKLKCIGHVDLP
ncbi:MAG: hypothetical protein NTZ97_01740 [Candidatus Moranbacteria bacterium]|nr:hypothetical protein [Candidatus Moranbacteria bacterium]